MHYQEILPPPALQQVVRFFWVLRSDEGVAPATYKLLAEGFPGMVFFNNNQYGAINGQTTRHHQFTMTGTFSMMGVYFYPYAMPGLFRVPTSELTNLHVSLDDFKATEFRTLQGQLFETTGDQQRLSILCDYLLRKLKGYVDNESIMCRGIQHVIRHRGSVTIGTLAHQSGLSLRQLERNFKTLTGFSPRLYSRLMRFQAAIRMERSAGHSLTTLAYAAGYSDQSHFIHEFREFAGMSPKQYFNLSPSERADNFVHLH